MHFPSGGRALLLCAACVAGCGDGGPSTGGSASPSSAPAPATSAPEVATRWPTDAEWAAAPEVELAGAKAAGCTARASKAWIQLVCRGEGATKPTFVEIEKLIGSTYAGAKDGVVTIISPIQRGARGAVRIEWGPESRLYEVDWPSDQATRPDWGRVGLPFPTPKSRCAPATGHGTRDDPCVVANASAAAVAWADGGWRVDNGTDKPLVWINTATYGYDAAKKQVDADGDPATKLERVQSTWITDVVPPRGHAKQALEVAKKLGPDVATVELELCEYGLEVGDSVIAFRFPDACKDERPSAGAGMPAKVARDAAAKASTSAKPAVSAPR